MQMTPSSIAAQLFTLRDYTKTPSDIAATLRRVRRMGYESVQVSAIGKIDPKELAKILRDEGLTCCVTHTSLDRLKNDTAAVIEEHRLWGCVYTALGAFMPQSGAAAEWETFIATYNAVAKAFAGSGISIGYHNHSHELVKYDRKTAMQLMLEKFDPAIWFEIDTYWITAGGGDPAAWIEKVAGRVPCVHLKDMGVKSDRSQFMMEVGEGNLNWPAILRACGRAGVKWYIVEQDTCYRDPFDSLEISLNNLRQMMAG
ncbi:MAG: sugar phosphate isomerase/epimerase family protein [Tepidisphaeraceae bacterium]